MNANAHSKNDTLLNVIGLNVDFDEMRENFYTYDHVKINMEQ